jgi:hypothetical protein
LVVVSQQAEIAVHDQINALAGIGTVADNVTKAKDLGDSLRLDVGKHRLERFEIAVDVADECALHAGLACGKIGQIKINPSI